MKLARKLWTRSGTALSVSGSGKTLILAHGVLLDKRMWLRQVEALSLNYRVVCYDMLGHGDSPDPYGPRTLNDFVDQMHEVVQQFSEHGRPAVGGFSMGGLISQAYAIKHHTLLSGLILISTVYSRSQQESQIVNDRFKQNKNLGVEHAVSSAAQRWFVNQDYQQNSKAINQIFMWMREGNFIAKCKAHAVFIKKNVQVTEKLREILCPTLVMTGENDNGSTPQMTAKMASEIPICEKYILDNQHHMVTMLDSKRVNIILSKFLFRCLLSNKRPL